MIKVFEGCKNPHVHYAGGGGGGWNGKQTLCSILTNFKAKREPQASHAKVDYLLNTTLCLMTNVYNQIRGAAAVGLVT